MRFKIEGCSKGNENQSYAQNIQKIFTKEFELIKVALKVIKTL